MLSPAGGPHQNGTAVQARIDRAIAKSQGQDAPTVLFIRAYSTGAKAKGSDSMTGAMLRDLGCVNIADQNGSLLEELSMDQVVLLSDNGNELAFSTDDVKIDLPSGIRIGNLVSIDYTGKITQKGSEKATAVRIAGSADVFKSDAETETEAATEKETEKVTEQTTRKNKKSSEAATEAKTDESKAAETKADASKKQTVKGTLERISMTGMTIKTSDGKELKFRIVQVPLYLEKGLTKGMSVKIAYRGELQSEDSDQESVEVVRIQNAD